MGGASEISGYDRMKELKEFDNSKVGVKGLSDSGITTIPKFFIHPQHTLSDLKPFSTTKTNTTIPTVDLSNINSDIGRLKIVEEIREAAKKWGFFQVVNHGVPVSKLDETVNAVKSFHEQTVSVKAKYYERHEMHGVMYTSNNDLYRSEAASWHDSIQVWMSPTPPKAEELPEVCRKEVLEWDTHAKRVAETVMELLSLGLGLEEGRFKELSFSEGRVVLGHYYPYCPQPDLTMGIKSHTDPGVITILLQNHVNGLQVKHGEGWVDVKPLPGGLIVNIGDFLQIISNGEYRSVQHRVLANYSKEPRISIVEFFNFSKGDKSGYYGPLPELLSPEKPALYRGFTLQEFTDNFYSKEIDTKSLVEKMKL